MANVDNPRGMWPIGHLSGGEIRTHSYILTSSTAVYKGDLLKVVAGGTVEPASAADAQIVVGVSAEYVAAADADGVRTIQVWDDPMIIFGIQSVSSQTPAATEVWATCDHVAGSGSATTGLSGHEANTGATNAQLRIIGKIDSPDNAWGEHVDLMVVFNEHLFKQNATTGTI